MKNKTKKDMYSVNVYCRNCGEGEIKKTKDGEFYSDKVVMNIPKGTLIKDVECPHCGNKKLSLKTE